MQAAQRSPKASGRLVRGQRSPRLLQCLRGHQARMPSTENNRYTRVLLLHGLCDADRAKNHGSGQNRNSKAKCIAGFPQHSSSALGSMAASMRTTSKPACNSGDANASRHKGALSGARHMRDRKERPSLSSACCLHLVRFEPLRIHRGFKCGGALLKFVVQPEFDGYCVEVVVESPASWREIAF